MDFIADIFSEFNSAARERLTERADVGVLVAAVLAVVVFVLFAERATFVVAVRAATDLVVLLSRCFTLVLIVASRADTTFFSGSFCFADFTVFAVVRALSDLVVFVVVTDVRPADETDASRLVVAAKAKPVCNTDTARHTAKNCIVLFIP